jgi:hypothetical protein
MWALFEAGELRPDTELTGVFVHDESAVDVDGVRYAINDAREEALIRQQGREAAFAGARGLAVLTGIKTCAGRRRRLGRCQAPRHAMSPSIAQVRKLRNDVAGVDCAHAARVAS